MSTDRTDPRLPTVVIRPVEGLRGLNISELWRYRELLYFMVWRDIKIRYKQTFLGVAWAVLQPFMTMVVFSLFFGRWAGMPSDDLPYPVFTFCALLPWQLFANALSQAGNSLVQNSHLISKVYFPRLIIPISAILNGVMDFLISFVVLLGMMFYYGITPTSAILTLPLFVILALATSLGVGIWLAVLNVQYRDVRYTIPFLTQFWFFVTPIVYAVGLVPEKWRLLYGLNPMAGVVEGFRWALLGKSGGPGDMLWVSVLAILLILAGGLFYFRRHEASFADVV